MIELERRQESMVRRSVRSCLSDRLEADIRGPDGPIAETPAVAPTG